MGYKVMVASNRDAVVAEIMSQMSGDKKFKEQKAEVIKLEQHASKGLTAPDSINVELLSMMQSLKAEIALLKIRGAEDEQEQIKIEWGEVRDVVVHKYINNKANKYQVLFIGKDHNPENRKTTIRNGTISPNGKKDKTLAAFTGKFDDNVRTMSKWVKKSLSKIECIEEFINPIQICFFDQIGVSDERIALLTEVNSNLIVLLIKRGGKALVLSTDEMKPDRHVGNKFYRTFHRNQFSWIDIEQ